MMKYKNKLMNYFFPYLLLGSLISNISCNTPNKIIQIDGNFDRHPVFQKSLPWQDERLTKLEYISHAYKASKDTFVITLIDMDENKSYINPKDVIVVSPINDSVASITPKYSQNTGLFSSEFIFDFYGTKYKITNVSSDGKNLTINKIPSNHDFQTQAIVTDKISNKLIISELKSSVPHNLLKTILEQNKKYILIDFWLISCTQCFENIPRLKLFEENGVGIINLFQIDDDEIEHVEKMISRFDIPGANYRSSPELRKYFSQNGFPFYVLIDVFENKILLTNHRIADHEIYLNFQ